VAEKRDDDRKKGDEQRSAQDQEQRENAIRAWVKQWRTRCEEDLSSAVCKEAPSDAPAKHSAKCGREFPCTRDRGIGEAGGGGRICGETCASVEDCESACGRLAEARSSAILDVALKGCLTSYVAAAGKGSFACSVESPRSATTVLASRLAECTQKCVADGPEAIITARESEKADKEGPALALGYRRCMVAADSTPLARKYQAYDNALYSDLLSKAATKCRSANRCDWVEKYSKNICDYSP
jgi:hypothetical protein